MWLGHHNHQSYHLKVPMGYFTVSNADLSSDICKNGVDGSTLYTKPNDPNASYKIIALPRFVFPKYFLVLLNTLEYLFWQICQPQHPVL